MAFSDTTTFELGSVNKGSTWSTTALTAGAETMLALRITGETLKADTNTVQSEEMDANGQTTEIRRTVQGMSGDVNTEMAFPTAGGALEDWIESAMRSTFTTFSDSETDISFTAGSTITSAANADFSSLVAGQKIRVVTTSGTNDGIYTVSSSVTLSITIVETTLTTENAATAGTVAVTGRYIRNGTSPTYVGFEKDFGAASKFFHCPAATCTGMNITVADQEIVGLTFNVMGAGLFNTSATVDDDGTYTSAGTNAVYDGTNDFNTLLEGGAANSNLSIKSLNINITNNARSLTECGSSRFSGVGQGEFQLSGSYEAFFEDNSIYTKFENDTATSLSFHLGTATTGTMVISILRMKYTDAPINANGKNTDVMGTYSFGGYEHSTYNAIFQIDLL